ncbi:hypothetical protein MesoLjLa_48190 [Mesorhizobium sp. L-2-11]|nr:hypothetical protein MesoLjLa_48190 [Mesorhizobium sp. L-2-11]
MRAIVQSRATVDAVCTAVSGVSLPTKAHTSGAATYDDDVKDSTERSEHDRHHLRFTIFPEDGVEMPEHTGKASLNDQTRVAKSYRL